MRTKCLAAIPAPATIKVGERPGGIALSKEDAEVFACAGDPMQILDRKTGKAIRRK